MDLLLCFDSVNWRFCCCVTIVLTGDFVAVTIVLTGDFVVVLRLC